MQSLCFKTFLLQTSKNKSASNPIIIHIHIANNCLPLKLISAAYGGQVDSELEIQMICSRTMSLVTGLTP